MAYPNQVLVSGHTLAYVNGVYTFDSLDQNNKPTYIRDESYVPPEGASGPGLIPPYNPPRIYHNTGGVQRAWRMDYPLVAPWNPLLILSSGCATNYENPSETWPGDWPGDTTDPVIVWGGQPNLTITEYAPTPQVSTFGLPADVAALIISRFGSVARFLRLRNQGQI